MSVAVAIYTGEREGVGMGSQLGKREMESGRKKERTEEETIAKTGREEWGASGGGESAEGR